MIDAVDKLLWDWADWAIRGVSGLGYASSTLEGRLATEGTIIRGTPRSRVPSFAINRRAAEVNTAVNSLRSRWRMAVKARYIMNLSDKDAAAMLGIGVPTYRRDLDLAHAWLAGRFGIP
jgi:DNA-directed RNA polymerase specialized sigma24 family protein